MVELANKHPEEDSGMINIVVKHCLDVLQRKAFELAVHHATLSKDEHRNLFSVVSALHVYSNFVETCKDV
jgi:hypothetical protein